MTEGSERVLSAAPAKEVGYHTRNKQLKHAVTSLIVTCVTFPYFGAAFLSSELRKPRQTEESLN